VKNAGLKNAGPEKAELEIARRENEGLHMNGWPRLKFSVLHFPANSTW